MRRVQLTLSEPVWRALKLAVMDSQKRASEIVEGLISRYVMVKPASEDDDEPLEMKVCPACAIEMPVKCRKCPDCGEAQP